MGQLEEHHLAMGSTARASQSEPDDPTIVLFTDTAHYSFVGDRRDPNLLGSSLVPEAAFGVSILYGSRPFHAAIMTSFSSSIACLLSV